MADGRFFIYTVPIAKDGRKMKREKSFKGELTRLLLEEASCEETEFLQKMEIKIKKPTRLTVLVASVYKKAISGDLSSIKEIISIMGEEAEGKERVILLDDISKQA